MKRSKTHIIFVIFSTMAAVGAACLIGLLIQRNHTETLKNRRVGLENQFYARTVVCILSKTPAERTQAWIENCYDTAARETGVDYGTRYGDAADPQ